MISNSNFDGFAGINFKNLEKTGPNLNLNAETARSLAKVGFGTLLIDNANENPFHFDSGSVVAHFATPKGDELLIERTDEVPMETGGLEIVRSRGEPPPMLKEIMPIVNGPDLRMLGRSKWDQYGLAEDFMPKTILVGDGQMPDKSSLDQLHGDKVVIKADSSMASQFMKMVTKSEVGSAIVGIRQEFAELEKMEGKARADSRIIIQEFVPGLQWPDLEGVDERSRDLLKNADDTELRVYCYVDSDRKIAPMHRYYATARVFNDKHSIDGDRSDNWASVDQDSVPAEAWYIADVVSMRSLLKTKSQGGYLGIDLFYGDANDGLGRRIFLREINTRDPLMVGKKDNLHDALIQRQLLANAMVTIAKNVRP